MSAKAVLVNADGTVVLEDSGNFLGQMIEYPDKTCCECGQKVPTRFYRLSSDYARTSEIRELSDVALIYFEIPRPR